MRNWPSCYITSHTGQTIDKLAFTWNVDFSFDPWMYSHIRMHLLFPCNYVRPAWKCFTLCDIPDHWNRLPTNTLWQWMYAPKIMQNHLLAELSNKAMLIEKSIIQTKSSLRWLNIPIHIITELWHKLEDTIPFYISCFIHTICRFGYDICPAYM